MKKVRRIERAVLLGLLALLAGAAEAQSPAATCPPDSVRSGTGCMDRFEASVWRVPGASTDRVDLVAKIRRLILAGDDPRDAAAAPK